MSSTRVRASANPDEQTRRTAERLRHAVTRMARLMRQQDPSDFGATSTSALASVSKLGTVTLGDLAAREQVAPPTITKVVEKLVAAGLVTRIPDPSDRRVTRLSTTEAGERYLSETRSLRATWLTARLASLDPSERARLDAALDVLEKLASIPEAKPELRR